MNIVVKEQLCRDNQLWYFASIEGGPQDLLRRSTPEQALTDGREYASKHWQKTANGWKAI
jgi:hypothetical protein